MTRIAELLEEIRGAVADAAAPLSDIEKSHFELAEVFSGFRFIVGRPSYARYMEFGRATEQVGYDWKDDAAEMEKRYPGSLRLDQIVRTEDPDTGEPYIWVKITVYNTPEYSDRILKPGDVALVPAHAGLELRMNRECVWATSDEIERAIADQESTRTDSRADPLLRRLGTARITFSLPRRGFTGPGGVSDKDGARRAVCTKG